jgi:hypothetical protein
MQAALEGLRDVDMRPPQPLALSQTDRFNALILASARSADVTLLVSPPPTTIKSQGILTLKGMDKYY